MGWRTRARARRWILSLGLAVLAALAAPAVSSAYTAPSGFDVKVNANGLGTCIVTPNWFELTTNIPFSQGFDYVRHYEIQGQWNGPGGTSGSLPTVRWYYPESSLGGDPTPVDSLATTQHVSQGQGSPFTGRLYGIYSGVNDASPPFPARGASVIPATATQVTLRLRARLHHPTDPTKDGATTDWTVWTADGTGVSGC